jgi:hypothetical protein
MTQSSDIITKGLWGNNMKFQTQEVVDACDLGIKGLVIRFFVYDDEEGDIMEANEEAFLACPYPIEYERHTIFQNGVSQICLTKMPQA